MDWLVSQHWGLPLQNWMLAALAIVVFGIALTWLIDRESR
jgi:hypothetical protein